MEGIGDNLKEAILSFALNPLVGPEIVQAVNDELAKHPTERDRIHYIGFEFCYGAPMWLAGVPLDWLQVCNSLSDNGVDVMPILAMVRAEREKHKEDKSAQEQLRERYRAEAMWLYEQSTKRPPQ